MWEAGCDGPKKYLCPSSFSAVWVLRVIIVCVSMMNDIVPQKTQGHGDVHVSFLPWFRSSLRLGLRGISCRIVPFEISEHSESISTRLSVFKEAKQSIHLMSRSDTCC